MDTGISFWDLIHYLAVGVLVSNAWYAFGLAKKPTDDLAWVERVGAVFYWPYLVLALILLAVQKLKDRFFP